MVGTQEGPVTVSPLRSACNLVVDDPWGGAYLAGARPKGGSRRVTGRLAKRTPRPRRGKLSTGRRRRRETLAASPAIEVDAPLLVTVRRRLALRRPPDRDQREGGDALGDAEQSAQPADTRRERSTPSHTAPRPSRSPRSAGSRWRPRSPGSSTGAALARGRHRRAIARGASGPSSRRDARPGSPQQRPLADHDEPPRLLIAGGRRRHGGAKKPFHEVADRFARCTCGCCAGQHRVVLIGLPRG